MNIPFYFIYFFLRKELFLKLLLYSRLISYLECSILLEFSSQLKCFMPILGINFTTLGRCSYHFSVILKKYFLSH